MIPVAASNQAVAGAHHVDLAPVLALALEAQARAASEVHGAVGRRGQRVHAVTPGGAHGSGQVQSIDVGCWLETALLSRCVGGLSRNAHLDRPTLSTHGRATFRFVCMHTPDTTVREQRQLPFVAFIVSILFTNAFPPCLPR
jgi:hypothetical protein